MALTGFLAFVLMCAVAGEKENEDRRLCYTYCFMTCIAAFTVMYLMR
jgi:hypothetical protein